MEFGKVTMVLVLLLDLGCRSTISSTNPTPHEISSAPEPEENLLAFPVDTQDPSYRIPVTDPVFKGIAAEPLDFNRAFADFQQAITQFEASTVFKDPSTGSQTLIVELAKLMKAIDPEQLKTLILSGAFVGINNAALNPEDKIRKAQEIIAVTSATIDKGGSVNTTVAPTPTPGPQTKQKIIALGIGGAFIVLAALGAVHGYRQVMDIIKTGREANPSLESHEILWNSAKDKWIYHGIVDIPILLKAGTLLVVGSMLLNSVINNSDINYTLEKEGVMITGVVSALVAVVLFAQAAKNFQEMNGDNRDKFHIVSINQSVINAKNTYRTPLEARKYETQRAIAIDEKRLPDFESKYIKSDLFAKTSAKKGAWLSTAGGILFGALSAGSASLYTHIGLTDSTSELTADQIFHVQVMRFYAICAILSEHHTLQLNTPKEQP